MNAFQTERHDLSHADQPPILIAASSDAALARAAHSIEAAGWRIGARMTLGSARERIEQQPAASAVWLELDCDGGDEMDEVLTLIDRKVAEGRFGAVVSSTAELIDPIASRVGNGGIELIVDPDDAQRAAALCITTSRRGMIHRISDVASDQNSDRLRQLSDEVSRIAATLARLSSGPVTRPRTVEPISGGEALDLSADVVRSVIRARRLRSRFFPEHFFADPAWDMLLDLLQAEIAQLRVPVSSLCIAAAVPATTALRWLKTMVQEGIFVRRADPHDGRRVFVELAPESSHAMRRYFAEVGQPAVI